ncbi:hypothetical protein V5E97_26510 [Singulisphaera sp. Ch08]|uniref:AB hydrolase-1 domain-containing protein n=1 Tax=Singulisphaera sp. Ch08 TaxID=3120278 RepID=A0AAU7CAY4_9BACT
MSRRRLSLALLVVINLAGCSSLNSLRVREPEPRPGGHGLSARSRGVLKSHHLLATFKHHPELSALALRPAAESGRDPDAVLALAEVSYRVGRQIDAIQPRKAMKWYRDGAAYAAFALGSGNVNDAVLAGEVHDASVARLVRLVARSPVSLSRKPWATSLAEAGVTATSSRSFLRPARVETIHVASDLRVRGMNAYHSRDGMGVPVVACRYVDHDAPLDVQDTLYGLELILPATAVMRPMGNLEGGAWRRMPVHLELCDSYNQDRVAIGGRSFMMAANFTAPTAYEANRSEARNLGVLGTLNPIKAKELAGVLMPRPYEPGKIPVVFIHGLASQPSTWLTAYNDLLSDPEIRKKYQLWAVRYPSGEPMAVSSDIIKKLIRETCKKLDPMGSDQALNGMVVVGHSMGGIMTKGMISDTGDALWNAGFTRPLESVVASDSTRKMLADYYFLKPEPYIARAVLIAAPLAGSREAVTVPGRLTSRFIRPEDVLQPIRDQLIADNGVDLIQPYFRPKLLNGVNGLNPENPSLKVIKESPIAPRIPFHTIIAVLNPGSDIPMDRITDGLVRYPSAHLEGAQSEYFVRSWHTCLTKPETSAEVLRILHLHLDELAARSAPAPDDKVRRGSP